MNWCKLATRLTFPQLVKPRQAMFASLCLALCTTFAVVALTYDSISASQIKTVSFTASPLPLHYHKNNVQTVGQLTYLGGLKINSSDADMGGLSSLDISADGKTLLAVTDRGYWWQAEVVYLGQRLHGLKNMLMAPLRDESGAALLTKSRQDAEAVAAYGTNGGYIVSFEGQHRLRYYQANATAPYRSLMESPGQEITFIPPEFDETLQHLPNNKGLEAITPLKDGRLLVLSEGASLTGAGEDNVKGWLIGWGRAHSLTYQVSEGYKPTDMATLPNGDILVLERHFSLSRGAAARLRRIKAWDVHPGAQLKGELLAQLSYPLNVDNMEGLAVRQNPAGNTLIYILSDNNFNAIQRTLLMMFRLEDTPTSP